MFGASIVYKKPYYYISNFNFHQIKRYAKKFFKTRRVVSFIETTSDHWFNRSFRIHEFFIPELIYFLKSVNNVACISLMQKLIMNTWYYDSYMKEKKGVPNICDLSLINKEMNVVLNSYQKDFILHYSKKQIYDLNGYLLAFEQGLGKTITSLSLMTSLSKRCVVIIAPKNTLLNVWKYHIDMFYKNKKKIWIAGYDERDSVDCDYYIVNYESMSKLFGLNIPNNCGIIVDESHNFLHITSNRSQNLILLSKKLKCKDILLCSGTPLKALGTEMIPMLTVLDKRFDEDARRIFIKSFGLNSDRSAKIFHNRLGIFMYRKMKEDVLDLPKKYEITRKIKIPNGEKYTLDNVKGQIIDFIKERKQFYMQHKEKYDRMFDEIIDYLKKTRICNTKDFKEYLRIVELLRNNRILDDLKMIHWTVEYEKNVIIPLLPQVLKKQFLLCKSAVKYVNLKIMGEVIGGFLVKLRDQMCQQMIKYGKIDKIVQKSQKKSILFTSYRNCVRLANDYFAKKGYKPITVYGEVSNVESNIKKFRNEMDVNPLIATIQTLSTGVTLTEANTIIFLNKPWRYIEYQQASDRIHRIGQDSDVYIYTLLLDTGHHENLSTRMEQIETWSRDMFNAIVSNSYT